MNIKKTVLSVLVVILCFGSLAYAKDLSLNEAMALAVKNSKTVESKRLAIEQVQNSMAVKSWLPTFSFSGSVSDSANLLSSPLESLKKPSISIGAGIKWNLASTDITVKSENTLNYQKACLDLEKAQNTVNKEVMTAYISLLTENNAIELATKAMERAYASYEQTQQMYDASKASELTLLQAKINYEDSQNTYEEEVRKLDNLVMDFVILLGLDSEESINLLTNPQINNLKFEKLDEIAQHYRDKTVSVRSAEVALELAKLKQKNFVVSSRVPAVVLSTNLNYSGEKSEKTVYTFKNSVNISATFGVSVPLDSYLPWTDSNAKIKNNQLSVQSAQLDLESAKKTVRDSIRSSVNQINGLTAKTAALQDHLDLAQVSYNMQKTAYDAGYASFYEMNNAEKTLENAQINLVANRLLIISQLCTFSSILELDLDSILEYIK